MVGGRLTRKRRMRGGADLVIVDADYTKEMIEEAEAAAAASAAAAGPVSLGGHGLIYTLALSNGSQIAKKVIPYDDESRRYVNNEINALMQLSASVLTKNYISKLIAYKTEYQPDPSRREFEAYIYMEYLDGMTLRRFIESKYENNQTFKDVEIDNLEQALKGILYKIHENNWCHNDLSYDNILIMKDETGKLNIKLIDFGLAVFSRKEVGYAKHHCADDKIAFANLFSVWRKLNNDYKASAAGAAGAAAGAGAGGQKVGGGSKTRRLKRRRRLVN